MPVLLGLLGLVLIVVVVLVVTSGGGPNTSATGHRGAPDPAWRSTLRQTLPDTPVALAPDTGDTWAATRERLFQLAAAGGTQIAHQQASPGPASASASMRAGAVWVAGAGGDERRPPGTSAT